MTLTTGQLVDEWLTPYYEEDKLGGDSKTPVSEASGLGLKYTRTQTADPARMSDGETLVWCYVYVDLDYIQGYMLWVNQKDFVFLHVGPGDKRSYEWYYPEHIKHSVPDYRGLEDDAANFIGWFFARNKEGEW